MGDKYKIEKRAVIEMEFKTFVNETALPEIIRQGRKTIYRLLAWRIVGSRFFFEASTAVHDAYAMLK